MIGLIVATLGTKPDDLMRLLDSLSRQDYKNFYLIIVSQDNHDKVAEIAAASSPLEISQVRIAQRGLSLARNEGLKHVRAGTSIVTFPDDDCWYPADSMSRIIQNFGEHPDATAICYRIFDPSINEYYKGYTDKSISAMNRIEVLRVCSIEIFISLSQFNRLNIQFDERFGLGGQYISGEENIFLTDILKKKGIITYLPITNVYHKKPLASKLLSDQQVRGKGALFARIFGKLKGAVLLFFFLAKKIPILDKRRIVPNAIAAYQTLVDIKLDKQ